ncbi:MAG: hypothetical protein ABSA48_04005 [Terracidiphilus sp.]
MAKVIVERNDLRIEADLTFDQIKDLMGVNGHGGTPKVTPAPTNKAPVSPSARADFNGFVATISDRGRKFISTLKRNEQGIEANDLARALEFNEPKQIGGLTGGGLAKVAHKQGIDLNDVYRTEITTPNGKRTLTYYPGRLILNILHPEEKPAI